VLLGDFRVGGGVQGSVDCAVGHLAGWGTQLHSGWGRSPPDWSCCCCCCCPLAGQGICIVVWRMLRIVQERHVALIGVCRVGGSEYFARFCYLFQGFFSCAFGPTTCFLGRRLCAPWAGGDFGLWDSGAWGMWRDGDGPPDCPRFMLCALVQTLGLRHPFCHLFCVEHHSWVRLVGSWGKRGCGTHEEFQDWGNCCRGLFLDVPSTTFKYDVALSSCCLDGPLWVCQYCGSPAPW
jgi:hypothetical protein